MNGELAIRLRGVVKRYGPVTAVAGLDLDVPEATCVGLLGPNGAGKSTTMRMLTGQAIPDEGEVEVLGFRLPEESKQARAQLGVSPQLDNLDVTLTVEQTSSSSPTCTGSVAPSGVPRSSARWRWPTSAIGGTAVWTSSQEACAGAC
jgi:ABC-type multidrug transport system ATPase subunit